MGDTTTPTTGEHTAAWRTMADHEFHRTLGALVKVLHEMAREDERERREHDRQRMRAGYEQWRATVRNR